MNRRQFRGRTAQPGWTAWWPGLLRRAGVSPKRRTAELQYRWAASLPMSVVLFVLPLLAAVVLWCLGLQLFLRSGLSMLRKVLWTVFLVLAGAGVGTLLPGPFIRDKFLLLLLALPVLAAADWAFLRPARSLSFWLRACGYEVCTVFGVAGVVRLVLDHLAIYPLLRP